MIDVRLPKLGMATTDADIIEWHVAVGDRVAKGDVLLDVQTEKVDVTIDAPQPGRVAEILIGAGGTAAAGAVLCRISPE